MILYSLTNFFREMLAGKDVGYGPLPSRPAAVPPSPEGEGFPKQWLFPNSANITVNVYNILISALLFPKFRVSRLLEKMSFEWVYTPNQIESGLFEIRDMKDYPVLYTAMTNGVEVLITGDKDFAGVDVDMPEIMTPTQFEETFMA